VLADLDAMPDLDAITEGIESSLTELLRQARGGPLTRRRPRTTRTRRRAEQRREAAGAGNGRPQAPAERP
jgi:hypothetical protein